MDHYRIQTFVLEQIKAYKNFMKIAEFPVFELVTKDIDIHMIEKKGFGSLAEAKYHVGSNKHELILCGYADISKNTIFHEFTHMLDAEIYVKGDVHRNLGLDGFSEYHAAQVAFMLMLGARTIDDVVHFSMNTMITTANGEISALQYLRNIQQLAIDMFESNDFLQDANIVHKAFGVLYNYWGIRSICEMYADDYAPNENNGVFRKYISTEMFNYANELMHGWLNDEQIENSLGLYYNTIAPLIVQCVHNAK